MNNKPLIVMVFVSIVFSAIALWKVMVKDKGDELEQTVEATITQSPRIIPHEEELEQMIEAVITKNPQIITNALIRGQQQQVKQQQEEQQKAVQNFKEFLFQTPHDPRSGNANGDVKVVEFFDYRCGYCRKVYEEIQKAVREDGNAELIYKELPIFGDDTSLSRAALAAHKQGKYQEFHNALMLSDGVLNQEGLENIAHSIDLNVEQWKKDLDAEDIKKTIQENRELAQKMHFNATPLFVIGDTVIPGAAPKEEFLELFKKARS